MRMIAFGLGAAVLIAAGNADAQTAADTSPCFHVIEGQANVPPGAPVLVDRCTGNTFVLVRAKGGATAYRWAPIGRSGEGETVAARPSSAVPRAKATANCFSYNGRSYCP
jgi:hypothetical protein